MGGDNFDCGKFFQKLYGGRKFFLLNTGGKISFSITFPRQVFKVFHVETFLGGGKKENVPKNSKGGGKMVGDRGQNGEGKYFGNFLGG